MATLKAIKHRKSMTEELGNTVEESHSPKITSFKNWWDERVWLLNQWFEAGPKFIEDETFETIRSQIERGSKFQKIRDRCWKHIAIELDACSPSDDPILTLKGSSNDDNGSLEKSPRPSRAETLLAELRSQPPVIQSDPTPFPPVDKKTNPPNPDHLFSRQESGQSSARTAHEEDMDHLREIRAAAGFSAEAPPPNLRPNTSMESLDSVVESIQPLEDEENTLVEMVSEGQAPASAPPPQESSFMARQREFLRQKQEKAERLRQEKEKEEDKANTFAPKMYKSRASFSQISKARRQSLPENSKLHHRSSPELVRKPPTAGKPPARSTSIESVPKNALNTKKDNPPKSRKLRRRSTSAIGKVKSNNAKTDDDSSASGRISPTTRLQARRNSKKMAKPKKRQSQPEIYSELQQSIDNLRTSSENAAVILGGDSSAKSSPRPSSSEIGVDGATEKGNDSVPPDEDAPEEQLIIDTEPEEEPEKEFIAGSFFTKIDEKMQKGHFKIRDPAHFELTSMYKRKDKVTKQTGLSVLCGKLEKAPHSEKVISFIFDLGTFTEKQAFEWYSLHKHRFQDFDPQLANKIVSPKSLEKEEGLKI